MIVLIGGKISPYVRLVATTRNIASDRVFGWMSGYMLPKRCRLAIAVLLSLSLAVAQVHDQTLDDLIKDIFNTSDTSDDGGRSTQTTETIYQPRPTPAPTTRAPTLPTTTPTPPVKYKSCGYRKECVPRFLCKNDTIASDGAGIIDIRIDTPGCDYLQVCCDIPDKTVEPIVPPLPPVQHVGCGYRNPDGVGFRITGDNDNEAQFGEFPWMVAIWREEVAPDKILNVYECGGSLIAPTVVLTAAHCVRNRMDRQLLVRAGEWDSQTQNEILPHEDRNVTTIIVHEDFNSGSLRNDVAILLLDRPLSYQENIRPICLLPTDLTTSGQRCYATGWGKDNFGRDGKYQVILKKIDMPMVPHDRCQDNLRKTRLGLYYELHESFVCAGGEKGKDTCKGDGGSPLVCPVTGQPGRFTQVGIVSWGIGCGTENVPGVYANVTHLRPWIDEHLWQHNIDFNHFTT